MRPCIPSFGRDTRPGSKRTLALSVSIELLADHPDLVPVLARWHRDEWGQFVPGGSLEAWTRGLAGRAHRDRIPMTLVALVNGHPAGSSSLVQYDLHTRRDLTPWLAGVYVSPRTARGALQHAWFGQPRRRPRISGSSACSCSRTGRLRADRDGGGACVPAGAMGKASARNRARRPPHAQADGCAIDNGRIQMSFLRSPKLERSLGHPGALRG